MIKRGFSLIEIMVALAIMAIAALVVVPTFRNPQKDEIKLFVDKLNSMLNFAYQNTLITSKLHRVLFDFDKNFIELQMAQDKKDAAGNVVFDSITGASFPTKINLDYFSLRNFFVGKNDQASGPARTRSVWFYIFESGNGQDVIINLEFTKADIIRPLGLVLNPFTLQFKVYENFQKP